MSITIRRAHPHELSEAGRLTAEAYVADGIIEQGDVYLTYLADAAARDADAEVLVALDDNGIIVGTVTYVEPGSTQAEISQPGEAEMRCLAVAPSARGTGTGEALTRACLERARTNGAHAFVLSSALSMQAAHRLYGRLGFIRAPERDWTPVPGRQLWAFWIDLTPA